MSISSTVVQYYCVSHSCAVTDEDGQRCQEMYSAAPLRCHCSAVQCSAGKYNNTLDMRISEESDQESVTQRPSQG
jgi:hypothetical protein